MSFCPFFFVLLVLFSPYFSLRVLVEQGKIKLDAGEADKVAQVRFADAADRIEVGAAAVILGQVAAEPGTQTREG